MTNRLLNLTAIGLLAFFITNAHADDSAKHLAIPGLKVAQFDADDTYDPFADYSEFDEAQEEEADINFFRHGRFVTIGFLGGYRGFTQGLGSIYTPSFDFGLLLSYFFDLRFAMQFSYQTSDHGFHVTTVDGHQSATGTVGLTDFSLDMKYYINTQNVTKGLAKFNPYFIGGFAFVQRSTHIDGISTFGKENAMGFDLGAGIEFPMMKNKMYFGAQAMYQLINFPDKNTEILFDGKAPTHTYPNGDSYTLLGIIGVNF